MAANFLVCKWNEAKCHTVEVKCEILKFILNLKRKNNNKKQTQAGFLKILEKIYLVQTLNCNINKMKQQGMRS